MTEIVSYLIKPTQTRSQDKQIFPLRFRADAGLAKGVAACEVAGFYWLQGREIVVER